MKHVHYDKIVAKAANMDLVVFYKLPCEEWWQPDSECEALPDEVEIDYFLCLPQHKEAVLTLLNGGDIQITTESHWDEPIELTSKEWCGKWNSCHMNWYMSPHCQSRTKPRKEKRWILYSDIPFSMEVFMHEKACDLALASQSSFNRKQKIEIEVEI